MGPISATLPCPRISSDADLLNSQHSASFTVGGKSLPGNVTSASHRLARDIDSATSLTLFCNWEMPSLVSDLIVPCNSIVGGITFVAVPAFAIVMLITPDSKGSSSREIRVWSSTTILEPVTTGSTVRWGMAAWPPFPLTKILIDEVAANSVPSLDARAPTGNLSVTCNPKICFTSGSSKTPCSLIILPPAPPSSAG